jgi:hypothetical protein
MLRHFSGQHSESTFRTEFVLTVLMSLTEIVLTVLYFLLTACF